MSRSRRNGTLLAPSIEADALLTLSADGSSLPTQTSTITHQISASGNLNGLHKSHSTKLSNNITIHHHRLRIPNTCEKLGLRFGIIEEETNDIDTEDITRNVNNNKDSINNNNEKVNCNNLISEESIYENSPPKKSLKGKKILQQERNHRKDLRLRGEYNRSNKMLSVTEENSEGSEKRRKSSSIIFKESLRRDSVVSVTSTDSDWSRFAKNTRKISFTPPIKRRKSEFCRSLDYLPMMKINNLSSELPYRSEVLSVSIPVKTLQLGDMKTYRIDINNLKCALQNADPNISNVTIHNANAQQFIICDCNCNKEIDTQNRDSNTVNDLEMPPQIVEMQKLKRRSFGDIIQSMKMHPEDTTKQLQGCISLGSFAQNESLSVLLAKREAVSCLLLAAERFKDHNEILQHAITSLAKMTTASESNCIHIEKENGLSFLKQLLSDTEDIHIGIIQQVVDILGNMSAVDELTEVLMLESIPSLVINVMSRHSEDPTIAAHSCFIIGNLAKDYNTAKNVMYIGGVHVIVEVMKTFQNNTSVQENGCRALGCFASHDELCPDVSNAGSVEVVVDALATFQRDSYVTECACWALACLTKCEKSALEVCRLNVPVLLNDILIRFENDERLHEYGCWTLSNLSVFACSVERISSSAILDTMCNSLELFPENVQLHQEVFLFLIPILASSDAIQHSFMEQNRAKSVIDLMTSFSECPIIQERGLSILGTLAVNKQYRIRLEELNASQTVISAILNHEQSTTITEKGCIALTNLTAEVYYNKARVCRNGGVTIAMSSLNNCPEDENQVTIALKLLGNLLEIGEACYSFIEEKGVESLKSLIEKQLNSPDIVQLTRSILIQLASTRGVPDDILLEVETLMETEHLVDNSQSDNCVNRSLVQLYEKTVLTECGCRRLLESGAASKLVDILSQNESDYEIQFHGCKAIAAIAMHNCHSEMMEDMLRLVHSAMETNQYILDMQIVCCGALCYITEDNNTSCSQLIEMGGVETIVRVMKQFIQEERLLVVAFMTLENLMKSGLWDYDAITPYDVSLVTDVMSTFPDNVDIQIYGCKLISLTSMDDKGKIDVNTEPLFDILRRRKSMQDALKWAKLALLKINPDILEADEG